MHFLLNLDQNIFGPGKSANSANAGRSSHVLHYTFGASEQSSIMEYRRTNVPRSERRLD